MIPFEKILVFSGTIPHRAAAVFGETTLTWRQLHHMTEASICHLLRQFPDGIPRQACIVAPNQLNLLPWMAAAASLGIPMTGLDYTLPSESLDELVNELSADLLFISKTTMKMNGDLLNFGLPAAVRIDIDSITSLVNVESNKAIYSFDLKELVSKRPIFRSVGLTSGTCGMPKLVVRTSSFDQRRFKYFTERYGFTADDRFLVSMPLYHAAGNGWARMFMSLGATLYFTAIDRHELLAKTLCTCRITASVMTPNLLEAVIDQLDTSDQCVKLALRWLLVGGKHFAVPLKKRAISCLGKVVYEYYGTTETGVNTISEPDDLLSNPESVGRAFDGNSIAIVNNNGRRLEPFAPGTVVISSYMNMDHYGDGTANSVLLNNERYLISPDQGYVDTEGRLYLMNRLGDASEGAALYQLENDIRHLPCVADVALLYRKKDMVDCAIVVRREEVDTQRISHRLSSLASNRGLELGKFRYITAIPYSLTGKVRITTLQSLFSCQ